MQTIGERFEEARKRKGISIREAAEATKIRGEYLQKFENSQFDIDLSQIYVRGFLRTYANLLKLPAERIVADYCALYASSEEEAAKPRIASREVYGRMDITVTSASGTKKSDDDLTPEPIAAAPESEGAARPRTFARIGTSLPAAPFIEGRMVIKIATIAGAVLLAILLFWGIKSMVSSDKPAKPAAAAAAEPFIVLIAVDTVRVKVVQKDDGKELFQGTLVRGESRAIPKKGMLYVTYSEGKNLEIEVRGKRYPMPTTGYDRAEID